MTDNVSKQVAYVGMFSPVAAVSKQVAYLLLTPAPGTITGSVTARMEISATVATGEALLDLYGSVRARVEIGAVLGAGFLDPGFRCAAPPPKAWLRNEPAAKVWERIEPQPATSCEDDPDTPETATVLAYVDGTILVDVQGRQLKLIE